jgi:hypothetical protein
MSKAHRNCFFLAAWLVVSTCSGQTNQDVASLFVELCQPSTTDHAASEIARFARKDSGARQYIVERLPGILKRTEIDRVWLNAVRLAGELKAEQTIPALRKALSLGKVGGPHVMTFTTEMVLDDDVVAKAISQMGDAAIPGVRDLLARQAAKDRRRAVLILRNMGTPTARRVLQEHLPNETDPRNRDLIEAGLRAPKTLSIWPAGNSVGTATVVDAPLVFATTSSTATSEVKRVTSR